ncbi:MAG: GNAT family N-acetyltransferase [Clostridia bacterium]|nr:GNAT family N-acetyltransferase [Clostridia bacterium]
MPETVYSAGNPGELPEIIDFINYVFSQAARPHDFKTLLPKVYADGACSGAEGFHFLARQSGRIVGCVACRPTRMIYGAHALSCGYVGSVSVHPYHRSEGHMKRLMRDMLASSRAGGADMLILGGQRQRYEYFGFENAGAVYRFSVSRRSVRHALPDADVSRVSFAEMREGDVPFALVIYNAQRVHALRHAEGFMYDLRSWGETPYILSLDSAPVGYMAGGEIVLKDESALPTIAAALLERQNASSVEFSVPPCDKQRIRLLRPLCDVVSLSRCEMINVFRWENVLPALMELKGDALEDGRRALDIEGDGVYDVTVQNGSVCVTKLYAAPGGAVKLSHLDAQRAFFSLPGLYDDIADIPQSWRALPFFISPQDCF